MTVALVAVAAVALAGSIPLVGLVKREQRGQGILSGPTVVGVWALYTAIVVVVVLAALAGTWDIRLPTGVARGFGIPLIAIGLGIEAAGLASMASFRRMSGRQPDRLMTSGAFRYSRNPQNVGIGIALAGAGVAGSSGLALAVTAGFWLVFRAYVAHEEEHLQRAFGSEYAAYRERTPRFLGRPRSD